MLIPRGQIHRQLRRASGPQTTLAKYTKAPRSALMLLGPIHHSLRSHHNFQGIVTYQASFCRQSIIMVCLMHVAVVFLPHILLRPTNELLLAPMHKSSQKVRNQTS
jgi:hypothetical protein